MPFAAIELSGREGLLFLGVAAVSAGTAALTVFLGCVFWFRREQRRLQYRLLSRIDRPVGRELFIAGRNAAASGELVAQFKVNHGKQVVSVLEADGRRFVHVEGELSRQERDRMMRYLKSEGFMS